MIPFNLILEYKEKYKALIKKKERNCVELKILHNSKGHLSFRSPENIRSSKAHIHHKTKSVVLIDHAAFKKNLSC